jgi:hypothetical protein
MEDRRRKGRKQLRYFTRVTDGSTGRMYGYLANLTTEGAMMVSIKPVDAGTILRFQIDLPEEYAPRKHLLLNAESIWSQRDPTADVYRVGLKLVNLPPDEQTMLMRLLNEFGLDEL